MFKKILEKLGCETGTHANCLIVHLILINFRVTGNIPNNNQRNKCRTLHDSDVSLEFGSETVVI